ncbi:L,D-transpeptidase family protein [Psychromonas antarctica]|uniref:L,D-transpeptidase family protein n=1 Tax=Psychromonas antarctica TaxID=67573 RepID=UPI001EE8835A|nr:L,D-transpeptidase family protein [Psychromonas antarctica]MCG6201494.1 L,D-transpeptidase family protein [Psychromonas antarctica]
MELHFYPGHDFLAVINTNGHATYKFEAMGGPREPGTDIRMHEQPTTAGHYIIDKAHAYTTPSWGVGSKIRWGTPLQDKGNDIWYQLKNGNWASLLNDFGLPRQDVITAYNEIYNLPDNKIIPKKSIFNDFGPIAIRYFKDLNNNQKLDGKETLLGEMFHTTPDNEREYEQGKKVVLYPSHGCIHLKPADRDTLFGIGAFKPGTTFIVHKYNERFTGVIK